MAVSDKGGRTNKASGRKKSPQNIGSRKDSDLNRGGPVVRHKTAYKVNEETSHVEDILVSYTSRIRPIGNSQGVILNNQVMETAGLRQDAGIVIQAVDGVIMIIQMKATGVNTDISTWDKQFKVAIRKGAKPERDMFKGIKNDFDEKEW